MLTRIDMRWALTAILVATPLVAGCPPPPECLPGSPCADGGDAMPSDDFVMVEAGPDGADVSDVPDALDASDGSDALDAADATDASDAADAGDVLRTDTGPTDARMCPSPGPDAGVCSDHSEVTLPLPGSVCGTLTGASQIDTTSCQPNTRGPEAVMLAQVATRTGLALTVHSTLDTVLSVRRDCSAALPGTEIACNDTQPGVSSALRMIFDPGAYQIVVDQFGASATGGDFVIDAQTYVPAANATCATAAMLTPPTDLPAESIGTGDSTGVPCRTTDRGPARFYRVSVGAGQTLTVTVHPTAAWRPVVHAFTACGATAICRADATISGTATDAVITWMNAGTSAEAILVAVAAAGEPVTDVDQYSLSARLTP